MASQYRLFWWSGFARGVLSDNHSRASEHAHALNLGFPAGRSIDNANIAARTQECLGFDSPPAQRTAEQHAKIDTVVNVIGIPESAIQSHMKWGMRRFQDIVSQRTGSQSLFGNMGVYYCGSADGATLSAGIERFFRCSENPCDAG